MAPVVCVVSRGREVLPSSGSFTGDSCRWRQAGGPLWESMAWLMIFGLIVATVLTLIIVPSLYSIFVETLKMSPVPGSS